jgi:hypothetical protein
VCVVTTMLSLSTEQPNASVLRNVLYATGTSSIVGRVVRACVCAWLRAIQSASSQHTPPAARDLGCPPLPAASGRTAVGAWTRAPPPAAAPTRGAYSRPAPPSRAVPRPASAGTPPEPRRPTSARPSARPPAERRRSMCRWSFDLCRVHPERGRVGVSRRPIIGMWSGAPPAAASEHPGAPSWRRRTAAQPSPCRSDAALAPRASARRQVHPGPQREKGEHDRAAGSEAQSGSVIGVLVRGLSVLHPRCGTAAAVDNISGGELQVRTDGNERAILPAGRGLHPRTSRRAVGTPSTRRREARALPLSPSRTCQSCATASWRSRNCCAKAPRRPCTSGAAGGSATRIGPDHSILVILSSTARSSILGRRGAGVAPSGAVGRRWLLKPPLGENQRAGGGQPTGQRPSKGSELDMTSRDSCTALGE